MIRAALTLSAAILAGCALPPAEPPGPLARETILAVSTDLQLLRFNAGQPQKLLDSRPLGGLQPGERVLGIDYRVARGQLFALGSSGRLYRIDPATALATAVSGPFAVALRGSQFGFDFNPTVDRIRVLSDAGQNLRLHPDTGAVIDADPKTEGVQTDATPAFDAADPNAGRTPSLVAAGYSYPPDNDKITTNYAIDARQGTLVMMGSREGVQPVVSPNSGRLFTVGALRAGDFADASLDISDVKNAAYAALTPAGANSSGWFRIDLATGAATRIGRIGGGRPVVGVAIEP
jgi:hypothetical protein